MDRDGVPPEHTLMVGDSAIDHETALRAGVRCCLCAFGYGFLDFPRDRLRGDEWVVESPAALVTAVQHFAGA